MTFVNNGLDHGLCLLDTKPLVKKTLMTNAELNSKELTSVKFVSKEKK